jgi:hypothetical protein
VGRILEIGREALHRPFEFRDEPAAMHVQLRWRRRRRFT